MFIIINMATYISRYNDIHLCREKLHRKRVWIDCIRGIQSFIGHRKAVAAEAAALAGTAAAEHGDNIVWLSIKSGWTRATVRDRHTLFLIHLWYSPFCALSRVFPHLFPPIWARKRTKKANEKSERKKRRKKAAGRQHTTSVVDGAIFSRRRLIQWGKFAGGSGASFGQPQSPAPANGDRGSLCAGQLANLGRDKAERERDDRCADSMMNERPCLYERKRRKKRPNSRQPTNEWTQ